jgi:tetratricopeptide (TPR) repeat protein
MVFAGDEAHRDLTLHAADVLVDRLREPERILRHAWMASSHGSGSFHVNAVFTQVQAWIRLDAGIAAELVEAALDTQRDDGFIPNRAGPDGMAPDAAPAWPLLAQSASAVFKATGDKPFADRVLTPLARHLSFMHRRAAVNRVHAWPDPHGALVPMAVLNGAITADLTAMLIADIRALEELAVGAGRPEALLKELLGRKDQLIDNLESFFWDAEARSFADRQAEGGPVSETWVTALMPLLWGGLPDPYRKRTLARLCHSRAFGLGDGVPLRARRKDHPLADQRPAAVQALLIEALRRHGAAREERILRHALQQRLAASLASRGRLQDEDGEDRDASDFAPALAITCAQLATAKSAVDVATPEAEQARRRKVALLLAASLLLLLGGFGAAARSLELLRVNRTVAQARADYASGRHGHVVAALTELDSRRTAEAEFLLGKAYYRLGRMSDAERAFRTAEAIDPKLGPAWFNRALCLYQQHRHADALRHYEQVQELFATTRPDLVQRATIAADAIRRQTGRP